MGFLKKFKKLGRSGLNPFKSGSKGRSKKPTLAGLIQQAQDKQLNEMFPMPPTGGVGAALGLDPNNPTPTPAAPRFGPGYGGMRGMGIKQSQGTGEVQVAKISPTTGWRYDVNQ